MNQLSSKEIDGNTHNLLCHNNLYNIWLKHILSALMGFMRTHLQDNLVKILSELCVSTHVILFAGAFDKIFNLCAKYPKEMDKDFLMWMKDFASQAQHVLVIYLTKMFQLKCNHVD